MRNKRSPAVLAGLVLFLAGCGAAVSAPAPLVITGTNGDSAHFRLTAGDINVAWTSQPCSYLGLELDAASGWANLFAWSDTKPTGFIRLNAIDPGDYWISATFDCPYTVTITRL